MIFHVLVSSHVQRNCDLNVVLFVELNMNTCRINSIIYGGGFHGPLCIHGGAGNMRR